MIFMVIWLREAEDELARLWTTFLDRAAIAAAADFIDSRLRQDPEKVGESRGDGFRIVIEAPLTVYFRVRPQDRIVEVTAVRYFTRRK